MRQTTEMKKKNSILDELETKPNDIIAKITYAQLQQYTRLAAQAGEKIPPYIKPKREKK